MKIIETEPVSKSTYRVLMSSQDFSQCGSKGFLIKKPELDKMLKYIMNDKDAEYIDNLLYKSGICECDYLHFKG
jgi:hypothetical protein